MITVRGKNVRYYVKKDGDFVLAICSTNLSRRRSGGTLTTLVKGAGRARRFKPTISEESLTFEGLLTIDTPANFQFYEFEIGAYYDSRIVYDDDNGNTIQLDGQTLVTGIDDNNGAADWSTWSVTMVKNGRWTQTGTGSADIFPPEVIYAVATGPHTVRVTFNEAVVATTTGWTVYIFDLLLTSNLTAVSGSGDIWDFTTTETMSPGQTLFLNYSTTGNTLDLVGNEMDNLTNFPIENGIIAPAVFTAYANYFNTDPFVNFATGVDPLPWATSGVFPQGGSVSLPLTGFPINKWVAIKVPDTEPIKTNWYNTSFNYGTLPDSVFRSPITPSTPNGFIYYLTRLKTNFDISQPITLT
jgi:hypothetical protein